MKKLTYLIVMSVLIGLIGANELKAQNYAAPYLLFSNSAEAAGYGEAYSTLASGASAAFWNPAGLAQVENFSFSGTSAIGLMYDRQFSAANVAYNLDGIGTIGLSASYSGVTDITGYNNQGQQTGSFDVTNMVFGLSYARMVTENLSIGVTGRFINQDLNVVVDNGYAFDLGARYDRDMFTLGAAFQSLAGKVGPDELPSTLRGGVAIRPVEGLHAAADFVIEGVSDDVPARRYANLGIGYDVNVGDAVVIPRIGLNDGSLAMGAGIGYNAGGIGIRIDYAFVNEASDLFGTSHRVGIVINGL